MSRLQDVAPEGLRCYNLTRHLHNKETGAVVANGLRNSDRNIGTR
jgi:hypothetical protein